MSTEALPSIAGGWLGTYYYLGTQRTNQPARFEASFEGGAAGQFAGTILDDSRLLGMADVRGHQIGLIVRFSKVYQKVIPGGRTMRVEYEGSFSEDGRVMCGRWRITGPYGLPIPGAYGTWEAHRAWVAEEEPEALAGRAGEGLDVREALLA